MKRFDYYFANAIISWYNKRMPQRTLNNYIKEYGQCFRIVEVK